jgi:hypothetical protein
LYEARCGFRCTEKLKAHDQAVPPGLPDFFCLNIRLKRARNISDAISGNAAHSLGIKSSGLMPHRKKTNENQPVVIMCRLGTTHAITIQKQEHIFSGNGAIQIHNA